MTVANPAVPGNLAAQLRRSERRKKTFAISLTLPLLIFLLAVFIVPIGALLVRAVERYYPPPLAISVFVSPQSVIH